MSRAGQHSEQERGYDRHSDTCAEEPPIPETSFFLWRERGPQHNRRQAEAENPAEPVKENVAELSHPVRQ